MSIVEDPEYKRLYNTVMHIYNVSLKNNKGYENVKNLIQNIVDYFEFIIEYFLNKFLEEKKIEEIPEESMKKYKLFLEKIENPKIVEILSNYPKLKKYSKSEIIISNEFRKNMLIKFRSLNYEETVDIKFFKSIIENIRSLNEELKNI